MWKRKINYDYLRERSKRAVDFSPCWLNYAKVADQRYNQVYICCTEQDPIITNALYELKTGFDSMFGINSQYAADIDVDKLPGTLVVKVNIERDCDLHPEGYWLKGQAGMITLTAKTSRGILYGAFALLRKIQLGLAETDIDTKVEPSFPLRMLNHWDNMNGTIERGYSGNSFFFDNKQILFNERTRFYARLVASVGINAVVINNVNVDTTATKLITREYFDQLRPLANLFSEYGITLYLSINYAAPITLGDLDTADPYDERVKQWWKAKAQEVFSEIPNLGGFLVKADSEGRPGPFTYGRNHADGANMLAEAVEPYGGKIIWRCFVYNCQQDWRDRKTDRARAAYDIFMPLDGQFKDNVILQIKNGPMDFQVREPVHPLFCGLKQTNMMLEVQIAQEYTGQQRHVCYLIPWFKEILNFHTHCGKEADTVADIVSGRTYNQTNCGIVAVANTGNDYNWTGHDLAAANLYGFGRMSFDSSLSAEKIAEEWIKLTYGIDPVVVDNLRTILMMSWPAYEKYTVPLGIGWMVNPSHHYGPNVDGYEYDRWGTYHRADWRGLGVDRSSKGTGYATLYNEPEKSVYEHIETCPEELLLFFHYVPYTYRLKSGKTLIQHIYDTHFEGVEDVEKMIELMRQLEGRIDPGAYGRIMQRMDHQLWHAKEWRDVINSYFYRKSGIPDEKGRPIY